MTTAKYDALRKEPDPTLLSWLWCGIRWLVAVAISVALGIVPYLLAPAGGGPFVLVCPILNLLLGIVYLAYLGDRGCSPAATRVLFYAFTTPTWIFIIWFAPDLFDLLR